MQTAQSQPPRITTYMPSHKQLSLPAALTVEQIQAALPGVPDKPGDESKVTHEWKFFADGHPCNIWDYRGFRWSAYGPREIFERLGLLAAETEDAA